MNYEPPNPRTTVTATTRTTASGESLSALHRKDSGGSCGDGAPPAGLRGSGRRGELDRRQFLAVAGLGVVSRYLAGVKDLPTAPVADSLAAKSVNLHTRILRWVGATNRKSKPFVEWQGTATAL